MMFETFWDYWDRPIGDDWGYSSRLHKPYFRWISETGQYDWIGLRENLQETIDDFPIKYGAFL